MASDNLNAYNIYDLRDQALARTPKFLFEYVDRGCEDEVALKNNRAAFSRIKLNPRTLVDVSHRNQEITLLGSKQAMPVIVAPTASAGLMWHEGEIALARAARQAGIPFALSTNSVTPMEKVADQAGGQLWFQLYLWADRNLSHQLVKRAHAAGYEGLMVTVDGVVSGKREYNKRNGYASPFKFNSRNVTDVLAHPRWLLGVLMRYLLTTGMPRRENFPRELNGGSILGKPPTVKNDALNWDDLKALRDMWPGKLMVKGVLSPKDAAMAADYGADGVIVSNHGGRNLDSSRAPIEVLPEIVAAVQQRIAVVVDSGFRRGSDVVKALAMGANAVMLGRAPLYGTAMGGEAGATRALEIIRDEIDSTMALLGCCKISDLNAEHVSR